MATTPVVITHNRGALIPLGMYDREGSIPGADLETGLTFEAADFQLQSDEQSFTNLTAEYGAFTSGSIKPLVGQTLTGATSTETCVVIGFVLSSSVWSTVAAGTMFVEQVSGVFTGGENLNNTTTGDNNVMTLTADFTPSIGAAMVGVGGYAAITSAEAAMSSGILRVQDQTGTQVFIDDLIPIMTGGSIDATFLPVLGGLIHATKVKTTTTTTDYLLVDGPSADGGIPKGSVVFFVDQSPTGELNGVVQSLAYTQSTGRLTVQTAPGIAVVSGDLVYIVAANPALAVIEEDTTVDIPALLATAQLDLDQITGADGATLATAQGNYTPATAAALATAQTDLDTITDTDGVILGAAGVDLVWDEVLTGATHNVTNSAGRRIRQLQEAGGYSGGRVYVDTVNGAAGTTAFENGTDVNPVNSFASAITIAGALGAPISTYHIAAGSTITLAATLSNSVMVGDNWTLALGGQSIDGSVFIGASVSGIATNTSGQQFFVDCTMGAVTLPGDTHVIRGGLSGTQTAGEAGDYFYDGCHSAIAGTGSITFDFGAALNASNLNVRHHSGGWTIANMGAGTGTYNASFEGFGQIVWAASCSATSNASIRGAWKITDNASGAVTETLDDSQTGINAIPTTAMRGTDSAATAAVWTAARAGALTDWIDGGRLDLLLDTLITEMATATGEPAQGAPGVSVTRGQKIDHLYKQWRNRSNQTATTHQLYADDATTVDHKRTVSDDSTTFESGEVVTGP